MVDQIQKLVLHLGGEPAEHGELDAPLLAVEVAPRLGQAAGRPLDVAEDLPDEQLLAADLEPGQLGIAVEVAIEVADAAQMPVVGAEAPGPDERPGKVLDRVGEVRELPVEHGDDPVVVDCDVPDPPVAVDLAWPLVRAW